MFTIKEIFYTVQGEGANAGRAAVFVRFAGCNGWSGKHRTRKAGPFPCSMWCDTDFDGGIKISEDELVRSIVSLFPLKGYRLVVLTGGEPALQLTESLLVRLREEVAMVAIETNGSLPLPSEARLCWRTISPKTESIVQDVGSELKLVYPTIEPEKFDHVKVAFRYLQPLDDSNKMRNTERAIEYVKAHPTWRLSLQTQKYAGFA